MENNSISINNLKINELEKLISEKEKFLGDILFNIEKLKIDLSLLKREYDIKIGRLYLKNDQINIEILKYKEIENLISKGLNFKESCLVVEERFKKQKENINKEYEKINSEEIKEQEEINLTEKEQEEIKKLYRKLAHKYHPDLNNGDDSIMKQVNIAYANKDIETLKKIDSEEIITNNNKILSIEDLEKRINSIEILIKKSSQELEELQNSDYFILKTNIEDAKLQNRDILKELSEKILEDISKKESELRDFKKKYGEE